MKGHRAEFSPSPELYKKVDGSTSRGPCAHPLHQEFRTDLLFYSVAFAKVKVIKEPSLTGICSSSQKTVKDTNQLPMAKSVHDTSGLPCLSDSAILIQVDV